MKKIIITSLIATALIASLLLSSISNAQPYGVGIYNENVSYGDQTSLSISTSGNISIPITPTSTGVLAKGSSVVTVTSTDVKGYSLYIRALDNTYMDNYGAQLPTSSNNTPSSLAINTWGYNTDATNNFVGISLNDVLIHATSVTKPAGDATTVTYGIKLDMSKPAGNYVANVVYTAVPQTN